MAKMILNIRLALKLDHFLSHLYLVRFLFQCFDIKDSEDIDYELDTIHLKPSNQNHKNTNCSSYPAITCQILHNKCQPMRGLHPVTCVT